jgi:hypothetical protein
MSDIAHTAHCYLYYSDIMSDPILYCYVIYFPVPMSEDRKRELVADSSGRCGDTAGSAHTPYARLHILGPQVR